ncbi:MAG: elongation factor Ts [Acidimicrobiia bacterium]|nr:elongation factor Ts [Acidimicrobiia bacterium]
MSFSAKDVQDLRKMTGAGMMDAKRALEETGGDAVAAADLLREKGLAEAAKRADRAQTEGTIGSYLHSQAGRSVIGVLVDLASETDFVAKSDDFQQAANDIAMHIAAARPGWVSRDEVPDDLITSEKAMFEAQARNDGKPENVLDKIVAGKLEAFYGDNVLYDQEFVRKEAFEGTVGEMVQQMAASMGENISVRRFSRVEVGEGVETEDTEGDE